MRLLDRVTCIVSIAFAICASSIIAVIMVLTTADVIKRFLTGSSIPGVTEFSEVFLVAAVYLGLAFAMRIGAHIGVDIVIMRLKPKVSKVVQLIGMTFAIVVLVWMTVETTGAALHSLSINEYRYGLIKVPVWPAKLIVPIGLGALILECVRFVATLLTSEKRKTSGDSEPEPLEAPSWN